MLTDMQLKALKPAEKIYKVLDQRGLYVAVTATGVASSRFDYRLNGRRETASLDHPEIYLRTFFDFLGVTRLEIVRAEGLNISETMRRQAIASGLRQIAELSIA